jgi:hypothetical protein
MTWMWLFAWNTSWLTFALLYVSLETKLGGDPVQGEPGRKLERSRSYSLAFGEDLFSGVYMCSEHRLVP